MRPRRIHNPYSWEEEVEKLRRYEDAAVENLVGVARAVLAKQARFPPPIEALLLNAIVHTQ